MPQMPGDLAGMTSHMAQMQLGGVSKDVSLLFIHTMHMHVQAQIILYLCIHTPHIHRSFCTCAYIHHIYTDHFVPVHTYTTHTQIILYLCIHTPHIHRSFVRVHMFAYGGVSKDVSLLVIYMMCTIHMHVHAQIIYTCIHVCTSEVKLHEVSLEFASVHRTFLSS
jgi:hypothetical protein